MNDGPQEQGVSGKHAVEFPPENLNAEQEIEWGKGRPGGLTRFLYNFSEHFPTSHSGAFDHRKNPEARFGITPGYEDKHSDKFKSGTVGDFYKDFDQSIKDANLDAEFLKKKRDEIESRYPSEEKDRLRDELSVMIAPVYIKMRERGYKFYDLTI